MSFFDPVARVFWRNKYLDADAYAEGVESGKAQGRREEYDAFWDAFQLKGTRTLYSNAFAEAWDDDAFNPKYEIAPTNANTMFQSSEITDLRNKKVTFANATQANSLFQWANIVHSGVVDLRNVSKVVGVFYYATKLKSIDLLAFKDGATIDASVFNNCTSLTDVSVDGVIGTSLNLQWSSKLSVESLKNILAALKNFAGTADEFAHEIKFSDTSWQLLESSGPAPDGGSWKEYVAGLGWLT